MRRCGRSGEALLLAEVGLGGAGEIGDAEAAAFDLEAGGDGDVELVEIYGGVEAVAEGGDDAGAKERADVVRDVLGCEEEGEQENGEHDADGREPAVAGAMRAARRCFAGGRAQVGQVCGSKCWFDAAKYGNVTRSVACGGRLSQGLKPRIFVDRGCPG